MRPDSVSKALPTVALSRTASPDRLEAAMPKPELPRISNILGGGTLAAHQQPKLRLQADSLGATPTLLTQGRFDFNRATASEPSGFGYDGVLDVSPLPEQLQQAVGNAGSDQI